MYIYSKWAFYYTECKPVNMTVICLLACTFFPIQSSVRGVMLLTLFFSQRCEKKRAIKRDETRKSSLRVQRLIYFSHFGHGVECSLSQMDYSNLESNSLSDNHKELLYCPENINCFTLITVAKSFYMWKNVTCRCTTSNLGWFKNNFPQKKEWKYTDLTTAPGDNSERLIPRSDSLFIAPQDRWYL